LVFAKLAAIGTFLTIADCIQAPMRRASVMRLLQTFRDEHRSRHFDLVGDRWSIDLVTVMAAGILLAGFVCAFSALLAR
jgi:hypothetical protein